MQKGNIGVTTENIFPVIKKFLYSDHEIFLREMVSNAVDATQKMKTLAAQGEYKEELGDLTVRVSLDADKGTITISDHGIGMTEEEIDKYHNPLNKIICEETIRLGGSMVHHHGIGKHRVHWSKLEHGSAWALLEGLKKQFDPNGIMNTGTIYPIEK